MRTTDASLVVDPLVGFRHYRPFVLSCVRVTHSTHEPASLICSPCWDTDGIQLCGWGVYLGVVREITTVERHVEEIEAKDTTMKYSDTKTWRISHPNADRTVGALQTQLDDKIQVINRYQEEPSPEHKQFKPTVKGCSDLTSATIHAVMIWNGHDDDVDMDRDAVCVALADND